MIIVFDLTSYQSFRNIERWLENICTEADSRVIRVVVGNKCDLKEREVSKEDIKLLTEHYGLCYFETSAKTGEKINNLFQFMAERIYDEWADKPSNLTQSQTLRKNKKKEKNDFCCF